MIDCFRDKLANDGIILREFIFYKLFKKPTSLETANPLWLILFLSSRGIFGKGCWYPLGKIWDRNQNHHNLFRCQ
jgi:hypothetical protein